MVKYITDWVLKKKHMTIYKFKLILYNVKTTK